MQAAGSLISAAGSIYSGQMDSNVANTEAAQLRINAGQAFAAGTNQSALAQRQAAIVQSKATAIAGASGAGAGDSTVSNIKADIGRTGEYNSLEAIYQGKSAQQQMDEQAALTTFAGNQAKIAGYVGAAGDLVGQGGSNSIGAQGISMFDKYAGDMPDWMTGADSIV